RTDLPPPAPVGYAATSWPCLAAGKDAPPTLGCPVVSLPALRDDWMQWTVQPFVSTPVDLPADPRPPTIPTHNDGLYYGERLDVTRVDVGAHLEQVKKARQLGKTVVLHLYRSGDGKVLPTSPIRVKGSDLKLFFETYRPPPADGPGVPGVPTVPQRPGTREPPPKKEPEPERLLLTAESQAARGDKGLIDVEDGNLEIVGGEVRFPDFAQARLPEFVVRVKGGSLRLHDCRLTGPLFDPPGNFKALVCVEGGGLSEEDTPACAVHAAVLT